MTHQRKKPPIRSFQRQVLIFVAITVLVFGAVVYFAFSRTVIAITPTVKTRALEINLMVSESLEGVTPESEEAAIARVEGTVIVEAVDASATISALLELREEPARAGGMVTIVNQWTKTQPLQAGTRLLSSGGILFRTVERVDVPAGGNVETTVLADEAGKSGEVTPGRFEIVALWPGLKSQIYAESSEPFTGGARTIARVTQSDLNEARTVAMAEFEKQAKITIDATVDASPQPKRIIIGILPTIEKENPGAEVDDEKSAFSYSLKGLATGVLVSPDALHEALLAAAARSIPDDYRLTALDETSMAATVLHADPEKKTATVKISIDGSSVIRLSSAIFARDAIVGRDRQEIQSHFSQFDDIASVDIHFSPFWVLRAPQLPDHIEIQLKDPVSN